MPPRSLYSHQSYSTSYGAIYPCNVWESAVSADGIDLLIVAAWSPCSSEEPRRSEGLPNEGSDG